MRVGDTATVDRRQNAAIGLTSLFSPTFLNNLSLGFIRYRNFAQYGPDALSFGGAAALGFTGPILRQDAPGGGFPSIDMRGATGFADYINASPPTRFKTQSFSLSDNLTLVRGSHILKVGGDGRKNVSQALLEAFPRLAFTNQFSGDGFSDFLLGIPSSINNVRMDTPAPSDLHNWFFAGYVQDDWKVSSKLTLNIGMRWEASTPVVEGHGFAASFDPTLGGGVGGMVYPRQNTTAQPFFTTVRPDLPYAISNKASSFDPNKNDWGPRFGFAWRPFGETRTVVRGGYGIYYYFASLTNIVRFVGDIPPHVLSASITSNSRTPTLNMNSAAQQITTLTNTFKSANFNTNAAVGRQALNTYNQQWSLSISRVLSKNMVVEVQYVGSKATHVQMFEDLQYTVDGPSPAPIQPRLPFPKWGSINGYYYGGSANYNGGIVTLERRYARGLSFKSAYTYSKSMQMGGGWGRAGGAAYIQNKFNLHGEVAIGADSVTHRGVSYLIWDLPFGPGKRLAPRTTGVLRHVIGGWQLSSILTVRSGFPFTLTTTTSFCGAALANFCRPNVIDSKAVYTLGGNGVDSPKYRQSSFPSPNFTFGNAGLNILWNNGFWGLDGSITKKARTDWMKEKSSLEFRFEAFNSLNHPTFLSIQGSNISPLFGRATTSNDPRRLQAGVKFIF